MGTGVSELLREVRRLDATSGVAAALRVITETARRNARADFAALVPVSKEWSNGLITVAVDGYRGRFDGHEPTTVTRGLGPAELPWFDEQVVRFPISANGSDFALLYLSKAAAPGAAHLELDDTIEEFCDVAGLVVERAMLAEEAYGSTRWAEVFGPLPDARVPHLSRATALFDELAETARLLTAAGCVAIATKTGGGVEVRAATGYHADRLVGRTMPADGSMLGRVIATLKAESVEDASCSEHTYQPAAQEIELGPTIVLPLRHRDEPIGALMVGNHRGGDAVQLESVLDALRRDSRLRSVLGLEQSDSDEMSVPLLRLRGTPAWDWRIDTLAHRELVIFSLLGKGLTNGEIAKRLFLSDKTVRNYVSNTLTKLGMRRVEAAVLAARLLSMLPEQERG